MLVKPSLLTKKEIEYIQNLCEVKEAYAQLELDGQGNKVSFTADISTEVKQVLLDNLGLNLFEHEQIPMRWIRGDTPVHADRGLTKFEKTYLVYLTNGEGRFRIGEEDYPIEAGTGFSFEEGLRHEVVGANNSLRLLLGPMSEQGFAVGGGGFSYDGATTTLFIRQDPDTSAFEFRVNDGEWNNFVLAVSSVQNTNLDPTNNILKVIFTTDLVLDSAEHYFVCASDGIQFGSTSLESTGQRRSILIDTVTDYPGFIKNGLIIEGFGSGYSSIYIYNLDISQETSTLQEGGGWIGQEFYGLNGMNNFIINCTSSGNIPANCGGIVGRYSALAFSEEITATSLTIRGCSSSGSIGGNGGGIVGGFSADGGEAKKNTRITVEQCYSTGSIGGSAGGIFGQNCGVNTTLGFAKAVKCYSTGSIGNSAGGIFGSAGGENGLAVAENCYSRGNIGGGGGGIYGALAGFSSGTAIAANCYSAGTGTGIFGSSSSGSEVNCYAANGNWSNAAANMLLSGVPSGTGIGFVWAYAGVNEPYELANLGYTPYTINIIVANDLVQTFSQTIQAGQTTVTGIAADASGNNFQILQITGGNESSYETISISEQTGAITTTTGTAPATYTIIVRSIGSYNITSFSLLIQADGGGGGEPPVSVVSCCVSGSAMKGYDYAEIANYKIGNRLILNREQQPNMKFNGYSEYVKYKMALGSTKN